MEYKLKDELKLNKEFQINNIKNSSYDELNLIKERNNNTIKNYIINLLFLIISLCCCNCKRREEKRREEKGREEKRREEKRREEKRRYLLFRGRRRE